MRAINTSEDICHIASFNRQQKLDQHLRHCYFFLFPWLRILFRRNITKDIHLTLSVFNEVHKISVEGFPGPFCDCKKADFLKVCYCLRRPSFQLSYCVLSLYFFLFSYYLFHIIISIELRIFTNVFIRFCQKPFFKKRWRINANHVTYIIFTLNNVLLFFVVIRMFRLLSSPAFIKQQPSWNFEQKSIFNLRRKIVLVPLPISQRQLSFFLFRTALSIQCLVQGLK